MSYNTISIIISVFDIWGKVICFCFLLMSLSAPVVLMVMLLRKTHTVVLLQGCDWYSSDLHTQWQELQASLARLTGSVYVESAKTLATCRLRFCGQQNIHCSAVISYPN